MAASAITNQNAAARAGAVVTGTAANVDGNWFTNTAGDAVLLVTNGGGSPITVTAVTQATSDSLAIADKTVSVAAGVTLAIGPFPRWLYNDASEYVQLTYSGVVTSVTVAVVRVTPETV